MAGLTLEGFVPKTVEEIQADLRARQAAAPQIGPNQDFSEHGALGQLNGISAGFFAELWEQAEAIFNASDPDAAQGYALTVLMSLTGTERRPASYSVALCTIDFDPGTTIPPNARIQVLGRPDKVFELDPDLYPAGLTHSGSDVVTGVAFRCTVAGPVSANAGTLTVIETTTSGWNSVTNPLDAALGRPADNDIVGRQRREDQLALRGGSTVRAIRADLLDSEANPDLAGVEQVEILENDGDVIDVNGLPPHSFEVVLDDGLVASVDDTVIAQTIFDAKPAGIRTFGSTSATATDENGTAHTVYFSRRDVVPIWVTYSITTNEDFPLDGDAQVVDAILAVGAEFATGEDVVALAIRSAPLRVAGVVDVPTFFIGTTASPVTSTNIPIGPRARASFDSSRLVEV